jgi:hypothetical protein
VFFQTKDGEWDTLPDPNKSRYINARNGTRRFADNAIAAPAYIAIGREDDDQLNPVEARRKQADVFDITKPYYAQIFPDTPRSPYEYLVPYLILDFVEDKLKSLRKELESGPRPKNPEEISVQDVKGSVRYAKWFLMGLTGLIVRQHYGVTQLDENISRILYPQLGDFSGPSQLGKFILGTAVEWIESYAENQMEENEEFDPALAFRQEEVWKRLKKRGIRRYQRLVETGEFPKHLFPKLS